MAYIDVTMRPPPEHAATSTPSETQAPVGRKSAARFQTPRTAMWVAAGIAALFIALVFALALAALGDPFMAGMVAILLLLPAAPLFGGDGRRRG